MADNLLYFPYINLPNNKWTYRSLLYYNTISAIVPYNYMEDANRFEPFMQTLVKEQLVIRLDPMNVLQRPWELDDPFMDFIQAPGYGLEDKRAAFQNSFIDPRGRLMATSSAALISKEKFNGDLMPKLEELGLASYAYDGFYNVERTTADYLMCYLSNIIAKKRDLLPTTDSRMNLKLSLQYGGRAIDTLATKRRNKVLKGVIPMPSELNLEKLLDFKFRYQRELAFFKNVVEQIALDPRYNDEDLLNEKIAEMNYHKEELAVRMSENQMGNIVFGTACGLVGAAITMATVGSYAGAALAVPSFANAVHSALKIDNPEKIHDTTGMKYLALVDKKLNPAFRAVGRR